MSKVGKVKPTAKGWGRNTWSYQPNLYEEKTKRPGSQKRKADKPLSLGQDVAKDAARRKSKGHEGKEGVILTERQVWNNILLERDPRRLPLRKTTYAIQMGTAPLSKA